MRNMPPVETLHEGAKKKSKKPAGAGGVVGPVPPMTPHQVAPSPSSSLPGDISLPSPATSLTGPAGDVPTPSPNTSTTGLLPNTPTPATNQNSSSMPSLHKRPVRQIHVSIFSVQRGNR